MLSDIEMKKSVAELGHSDSLKSYLDPCKIYLNSYIKSISPEWLGIFDWNYVWSSGTLVFRLSKMKKNLLWN